MMIIIGLGNPGKKYQNTRHNIGFQVIDEFREKNNFPEFRPVKKYNSLISEEIFEGKKVILLKPQTFMNNSGVAVKKITTHYKLPTTNLIIIHDDIDLPLGKIRIIKNRGSAGHKGVESVIKETGTKNFIRFRIGILPEKGKPKNPEKFVLQKFNKKEQEITAEVIKKTVKAIGTLITQGIEKVMNEYNK